MASAKEKLAAMKEKFKQKTKDQQGFGNNTYPFWNMAQGESAVVRFLPDKNDENPFGFFIEKLSHRLTINGKRENVPCLKQYGEKCPICDLSAAYYKKGDKDNGRLYWREKQYIAQALIVDDPLPVDKETGVNHQGQVRNVYLGAKIYEVIKDAFESDEFDDLPWDFEGGTNFVIKKTQNGEYAAYDRSKFERKQSDLDKDTIAMVSEAIVDLQTLIPAKPDVESIEKMLAAAISGEEYEEDEDDTGAATKPAAAKPPVVSAAKKDQPADDDDDDGDIDEEAAAILAEIKANRQNRQK